MKNMSKRRYIGNGGKKGKKIRRFFEALIDLMINLLYFRSGLGRQDSNNGGGNGIPFRCTEYQVYIDFEQRRNC